MPQIALFVILLSVHFTSLYPTTRPLCTDLSRYTILVLIFKNTLLRTKCIFVVILSRATSVPSPCIAEVIPLSSLFQLPMRSKTAISFGLQQCSRPSPLTYSNSTLEKLSWCEPKVESRPLDQLVNFIYSYSSNTLQFMTLPCTI